MWEQLINWEPFELNGNWWHFTMNWWCYFDECLCFCKLEATKWLQSEWTTFLKIGCSVQIIQKHESTLCILTNIDIDSKFWWLMRDVSVVIDGMCFTCAIWAREILFNIIVNHFETARKFLLHFHICWHLNDSFIFDSICILEFIKILDEAEMVRVKKKNDGQFHVDYLNWTKSDCIHD